MSAIEEVLFAGDTHGNILHNQYLIRQAHEQGIPVVFIVGDFGAYEHTARGRLFFDEVNACAEEYGVTVYFLDGNHDKSSLLLELYGERPDDEGFLTCRPWVRYAPRGHRWTWGGVRFMAFGGAYSVDKFMRLESERDERKKREIRVKLGPTINPDTKGLHWFPEEQATDEDVDRILAADSSPVDILLTHDKPDGARPPGWTYNQPPECYPNQRRIQRLAEALKPRLLVHGHLHYPYEQVVRLKRRAHMHVIGLDCDGPSFYPNYTPTNSWVALGLDAYRRAKQEA